MGEFLALLTALIWASMNISLRYGIVQKESGEILNTRLVMSVWGIATVLAIFAVLSILGLDLLTYIKLMNLKPLFYFSLDGILTKILAMLLLTIAFGQIGASRTAAIRSFDSVITCVLSFILLKEYIGLVQIGGIMLVSVGVILANLKSEDEVTRAKSTSFMKIKGGIIAFAAGACFSFGNIARATAIQSGGNFLIGVLINYMICTIVYGFINLISLKLRTSYREIGKTSITHYKFAGIMDVVGTFTLFASFTLTPVWMAVTLKSTQPLMVLLLSAMFLKKTEKVNTRMVLSSLMVVIGTCIIVAV